MLEEVAFAWHPGHRADLGHKSQGNCLMLHMHIQPILYCLTYFSHLDIFVLSVSKLSEPFCINNFQGARHCSVPGCVEHWCWVLCVGEELDEERPVNLKEPIQPTPGLLVCCGFLWATQKEWNTVCPFKL